MNIQLIIVFQIFIWSTINLVTSKLKCPPTSYTDKGNLCIFKVGNTNEFCTAIKMCEDEGRKFKVHLTLIGRNYHILQQVIKYNFGFWTSINNLAPVIQKNDKKVWMDAHPDNVIISNPSIYKAESDSPKSSVNSQPFIYVSSRNRIRFTKHSRQSALDVFCQYDATYSLPNLRVIKYTMMKINDHLFPSSNNPEHNGCYLNQGSKSIIHCTYKCLTNEYCRMVFYRERTKDCIQVIHINSNLPYQYFTPKHSWIRVKPSI